MLLYCPLARAGRQDLRFATSTITQNSKLKTQNSARSAVALLCLLAAGLGLSARAAQTPSVTLEQLLTDQPPLVLGAPSAMGAPTVTLNPRVAPLFTFGCGYGQKGWDAGACPVLLAKDEACAVITEEARAGGLHFEADAPTLPEILPVQGRAANDSLPTPRRSLTLDGLDAQHLVAFVFVSAAEANNWRQKCGESSLGEHIDIFGCASVLRDELASAPLSGYYAVFYDPTITLADLPATPAPDADQPTARDLTSEAHEYAREQLRQQVRGFVGWWKLHSP